MALCAIVHEIFLFASLDVKSMQISIVAPMHISFEYSVAI